MCIMAQRMLMMKTKTMMIMMMMMMMMMATTTTTTEMNETVYGPLIFYAVQLGRELG